MCSILPVLHGGVGGRWLALRQVCPPPAFSPSPIHRWLSAAALPPYPRDVDGGHDAAPARCRARASTCPVPSPYPRVALVERRSSRQGHLVADGGRRIHHSWPQAVRSSPVPPHLTLVPVREEACFVSFLTGQLLVLITEEHTVRVVDVIHFGLPLSLSLTL